MLSNRTVYIKQYIGNTPFSFLCIFIIYISAFKINSFPQNSFILYNLHNKTK